MTRLQQIAILLDEYSYVTNDLVAYKLNIPYSTARRRVAELVERAPFIKKERGADGLMKYSVSARNTDRLMKVVSLK